MAKWDHLVESDIRLRDLERKAHQSLSGLKKYIRELQKHVGPVATARALVSKFKIISDVEITFRTVVRNSSVRGGLRGGLSSESYARRGIHMPFIGVITSARWLDSNMVRHAPDYWNYFDSNIPLIDKQIQKDEELRNKILVKHLVNHRHLLGDPAKYIFARAISEMQARDIIDIFLEGRENFEWFDYAALNKEDLERDPNAPGNGRTWR